LLPWGAKSGSRGKIKLRWVQGGELYWHPVVVPGDYVPARCSPRFPSGRQPATIRLMPHFLVEIHMPNAIQLELERASRTLEAAQSRLKRSGLITRTIVAGLSREDDRLLFVIEARNPESARLLFAVALLPPGRIREIALLAGGRLLPGRHPRGDVDPGVDAELVEDVVDVSLDGPLGQE
jgi:hypothetical protein